MTDSYSKIIEVASQLMRKNGYHATSLQMIADKVGISKSTIFHHFKNKEAILLDILETTIPALIRNLSQIVHDNSCSGPEKLKNFINHHMNFFWDQGNILAIYLSESKYLGKHNRKQNLEGRREYTMLVKQIIAQIQREEPDKFKALNTTIITNSILGMCNWAVEWYKKNGEMTIDEIADQMYQLIYKP